MKAQHDGYPRNRDQESILTHWLRNAPNPGASLPSGHLRRRQNKYLQLSSSLFGDQDERDKIRVYREQENKDKVKKQLADHQATKEREKAEDDRVYRAMGIYLPPENKSLKPEEPTDYSRSKQESRNDYRKSNKTALNNKARNEPSLSNGYQTAAVNNSYPQTAVNRSYPQTNKEKRSNYEPSFLDKQIKSRLPSIKSSFDHLRRRHSFDYAPTEGINEPIQYREPPNQLSVPYHSYQPDRNSQQVQAQGSHPPGVEGYYPQGYYPYAYQGASQGNYPHISYPPAIGYPIGNYRSGSHPNIAFPPGGGTGTYGGVPVVYIPVPVDWLSPFPRSKLDKDPYDPTRGSK